MSVRTSGGTWPPSPRRHCPSGTMQLQHGLVIICLLPSPYGHPGFQAPVVTGSLMVGAHPPPQVCLPQSSPCCASPNLTFIPIQGAPCPIPPACPCAGHQMWLASSACAPEPSFLFVLWLQTSSDKQTSKLLCHLVGSNTHSPMRCELQPWRGGAPSGVSTSCPGYIKSILLP